MKGSWSLRVVPSRGFSWVGSGFFGVLEGLLSLLEFQRVLLTWALQGFCKDCGRVLSGSWFGWPLDMPLNSTHHRGFQGLVFRILDVFSGEPHVFISSKIQVAVMKPQSPNTETRNPMIPFRSKSANPQTLSPYKAFIEAYRLAMRSE